MGHKLTNEFAVKRIREQEYAANRMVIVTDNWCPNYPDNQVQLHIEIWMADKNKANVIMTVSGMDDDYMVLRSENMSPVYAVNRYNTWKQYIYDKVPDGCNHEWFFEHGFDYD